MSDLQRQIQQLLPELSGKNRRIAEELLRLPQHLEVSRLKDFAQRCDCDPAQVVRFCQRLGYAGFTQFRNALMSELVNGEHTLDKQLAVSKSAFGARTRMLAESFAACVKSTLREVSEENLGKIAARLESSGQILVAGLGSSGLAARDLQSKLSRLGRTASFHGDVEYARSAGAALTSRDALVAISFGGRTPALLEVARLAKANGAAIVALTNYPQSPLGKMADFLLETVADEDPLRIGSMTSLVAQLLVIDLLCTTLAGLHPEETQKRIRDIYGKMLR